MYIGLIFKILLIHALAVASPGPDFLVVIKNSLNYSRKIGVWTALGIATGIGIHVIYGIGGISLLVSQNSIIYNIVKYTGALYLIYMGVQSFGMVKKKKVLSRDSLLLDKMNPRSAFKNGFITNVLNPKATLFFLSIFSALIPPMTPSYILRLIAMLLILNTGLWFVLVSFVFSNEKVQRGFYKYEHKINMVFGILLISLAIKIMFI